ncbi:hypothetical protein HAX54_001778, partial [Datura stramonium]|nr:hypothetical protein [Datura stramonium]
GTNLSLYSGRIIKSSWNSHEDSWIFVRIHTIKSNSDYISVYEQGILLDEIDKVAGLPIYADWLKYHSGSFRNVKRSPSELWECSRQYEIRGTRWCLENFLGKVLLENAKERDLFNEDEAWRKKSGSIFHGDSIMVKHIKT